MPVQLDEQPTNGITYAAVLLDVSDLPDRLVPYLDLFADFITELVGLALTPGCQIGYMCNEMRLYASECQI